MKNEEVINVIESDEKIIGVRKELIKYLRHELVYTGSDSDIDIENYARIVAETSAVLNKLLYDYTDDKTVFCLSENCFGDLDIKEVEF